MRGQSEVLGFALVFGLVLSAVALIAVFGFGALEDTRDSEELNNAERAFDVLADNMADIHQDGTPSRATEISLQNAQLEAGDTVTFNLTFVGPQESISRPLEPIVFRSGDAEVVYVAGAILRSQREGGVMIKEPPFLIDTDRLVLPIIETQNVGDITSTGGQTVRVRGLRRQRQFVADMVKNPSPYDEAIINITSPRSDIWQTYLEEQDGMDCRDTGLENNIRCTMDGSDAPNSVFVSRTVINWEIET
jgi:hypothetical protein